MLPAPAIFSTWMEGLPGMCLLMCRPIAREWASKPPPAEKPTMMRMVLPSKNFSCPKADEISDPHKAAIQTKQVVADIVTVLIANASREKSDHHTNRPPTCQFECGVLPGGESSLLQFLKQLRLPGAEEVSC